MCDEAELWKTQKISLFMKGLAGGCSNTNFREALKKQFVLERSTRLILEP